MNKTLQAHMLAIKAGHVGRGNILGLRKAINTGQRMARRLFVGCTSPRVTPDQLTALENAVHNREPQVSAELYGSGLAVLRNPRYAKRFASVQEQLDSLHTIQLVRFDRINGLNCVPVYKATGRTGSFLYRNIPWQSKGNGPELLAE